MKMKKMLTLLTLAMVGLTSVSANAASTKPTRSATTIVWEKNVLAAYQRGVRENKPIVVAYVCPMTRAKCTHCKVQRHALFGPEMAALADKFVFVMVDVNLKDKTSPDADGQMLFRRLKLKGTPSISVLAPNSKRIEELFRMHGRFDADKIVLHLGKALAKHEASRKLTLTNTHR